MYQTIGFIGTGNMGSAVARAVARSGLAETILLSNRTPAKAEKLAAECRGLSGPIKEDGKIREVLIEFLGGYLEGTQSKEDTIQMVEEALKMYLAE